MHLNYRPAIIICIPPWHLSSRHFDAAGSLSLAPFNLNNTSQRGGAQLWQDIHKIAITL